MTVAGAILIPFVLSFALPGALAAALALRKKSADALLFILYAALFGFAFQIGVGLLSGFFSFITDNPALRVAITALLGTIPLVYGLLMAKKDGVMPRITISTYDTSSLIITALLGICLYGTAANLPHPYFNPATDQYYWLAYALRAAYDPPIILSFILRDPIYQSVFFLILEPYVAFLPKDLSAYQSFMQAWHYGSYALAALAMARLAYEALPVRAWGIFAPLAFYLLHWSNYYMISTDVVPQNTGIFMLIMGFILLTKQMRGLTGAAFIALFYVTHLATCAMFVLAVGTAKIAYEGILLIRTKIRGAQYRPEWHAIEKICLAPAFVVTLFYGLYGARVIPYRPLESIGYAYEYAKKLTLFDQPYMDTAQMALIWLALAGLALVPFIAYFDHTRRRLLLALGFGLILPWTFLTTPLVAYHAFFASWQSFRYYLVMYPSIGILAIVPPAALSAVIAKKISKNLAAGIAVIAIVMNIPILLKITALQQELVALDMITGRDGGVENEIKARAIREFQAMEKNLPAGAIVSVGKGVVTPYAQWALAPRPWFAAGNGCTERLCMTYDMFAHREESIWSIPSLGAGLIEKGTPEEGEARAVFEKLFSKQEESEKYAIYSHPRPR